MWEWLLETHLILLLFIKKKNKARFNVPGHSCLICKTKTILVFVFSTFQDVLNEAFATAAPIYTDKSKYAIHRCPCEPVLFRFSH